MRLHYGGDFDFFFFFFFFSLFSFKFTLGKRVPTSPRRLYHPSLLITVLLYNNMKQLFTHRRAEGSRCCARNDWMCPSLLYLFFFFFFLSPPPFSYSYFYFSFSFRYAHRRPPFYARIRTALFGQLRVESVAGIDRGSNFRHKIRLFARIRSRRFDSSRQRFSSMIRTWKFFQFLLAI